MSTSPIHGNTISPAATSPSSIDVMSAVKLDDFLKLMITELQNQDPLNPMDNSQILQQIGQMQSISSTVKLSQSLDAVVLGQNLTSASSLIAKRVSGLDEAGAPVVGTVDRVLVENGVPKLVVGDSKITLSNLREVLSNLVDAFYVNNPGGASGGNPSSGESGGGTAPAGSEDT